MLKVGSLIKRSISLGEQLEVRDLEPIQLQQKALRRLLKKASNTLFGQYYNFRGFMRSPHVLEEFRNQVPIYDYDLMHDRWWHMALNDIENVSWKGKVKYFALSSGTSGSPSKHIPITEDMLRAMRRVALRLFFAVSKFDVSDELFTKDLLSLTGTSDLQPQGGYRIGDLSGINASKVPFWLRPYYKPELEITKISNWNDRIKEIAKKAPEWDVGVILGIPAWLQLMIEHVIDYHKVETIHEIWPNLEVYIHGGVAFSPYEKSFERLVKSPLRYIDTYMASEGFFAYQARPATRGMKLLLNNGIFFEFIPFTEENFNPDGTLIGSPPTKLLNEVEEGIDYALVVTTCAGTWRYLIGDTIRFTDVSRSELIITGRTKHFLSVCGEHLSVDNMNQGIKAVEKELNTSIPEFTVAAIEQENYFAHKWYIGASPVVDSALAKQILDQTLQKVNADYATERESVLKEPQVEVIPVDYFYNYQAKQGKMGGQNKFPRVMKLERFAQWEAYVLGSLNIESVE